MSPKRSGNHERLLKDVLAEGLESSGDLKTAALAAFRRELAVRRVRRLSLFSAIAIMIGGLSLAIWVRSAHVGVRSPETARAVLPKDPEGVRRLSDDELLASFPTNSCFFAEVDGVQVLIFTDSRFKKKFLEQRVEADL